MDALSSQDLSAIILSFKVASSATILSLPFGFATAYFLSFCRVPGKSFIEGIINLPLVLPPVVIGYLLLLSFGRHGVIGGLLDILGIRIIFTLQGAVIASMIVGFPLMVRSIRLGMEAIDPAYLKVSRTLGAGWWDTVFSIIVPLCRRSLIAGMTLMFARSLGEFGATVILAGNIPGVTQTIPLAIYEYTTTPGGDSMALSLCLISIILSFGVLLISNRAGKKIS